MALLGHLRLVQIRPRVREIGAGVLPVGIEEQVVEAVGQVVVVGDVGPRARHRVVLVKPAQEAAEAIGEMADPHPLALAPAVGGAEIEEVVEAALLHRQPAVHVGLAEGQIRADEEPAVQRPVVQPDRHRAAGPVPELVRAPRGVDDPQGTRPDDARGEMREQHTG